MLHKPHSRAQEKQRLKELPLCHGLMKLNKQNVKLVKAPAHQILLTLKKSVYFPVLQQTLQVWIFFSVLTNKYNFWSLSITLLFC